MAETTDLEGPSLFARLCWCQCSPLKRTPSGLEKIEAISNFTGVTIQSGQHLTKGAMQTVRWGSYDASTRSLTVTDFGGWYHPHHSGVWTEPSADPVWCALLFLFRMSNFTYVFHFSEDFQRADITTKGNPLVICCCCLPCIPPWFSLPECIGKHYMVQADSSVKGDRFERYSGFCGNQPTLYYELLTVYTGEGKETRWTSLVKEHAPAQVNMTI